MGCLKMATDAIFEFLESSTIHGLVHISTAKSRVARYPWAAIVVACFGFAIHMITSSYKEWQESPVSTTITTHPITELEFPRVTVCPPRGSNTAVNHLLEKVKDVNFTERKRQELVAISREIFLEIPNRKHAEEMTELLSTENMRSIADGQTSLPEVDNEGMIIMKSSDPEGSFTSPGFGNAGYKGDFFSKPKFLHYMIEMVGEGELVISFQSQGNWSPISSEDRLQLSGENLSWSDAENFCASQGGHLASVTSQSEQDEITKLANGNFVWLGRRRKSMVDPWQWSDGRQWGYQNWATSYNNESGYYCVASLGDVRWQNVRCSFELKPLCAKVAGNYTLVIRKTALVKTFHLWWYHNFTMEKSVLKKPGFKIDWKMKNVSQYHVMDFFSKDLTGSVSTPGLGSLPSPNFYKERHEYTAVIELPHNITDVIGDSALLIDVDIVRDDKRESEVELWTGEPRLESSNMIMNWNEAENFCASKGGHLASVTSSFHQRRIKAFMEKKGIQSPSNIWLGGTDYEVEGEWTWSDGSKWGYTYWRSNEPTNASDENCLLSNRWKNWTWYDEPCDAKYPFICNVGTKMTLTSDTQLVFTSENISIPAMKFRWVSEPIRQTENENGELAVMERDLTRKTTAMTTNKTIGGLKLSWQLLGSVNQTKSDDIMSDVWKIKNHDTPYEKDMNMMAIMNLVQESKIYGVSQGEVWKALLKHRWDIGILGTSPCLNENQIAEVIVKTGQDLNLKYDWNIWIHEEDLAFGTQLYTTLCQCPGKLVEAAKLSAFFDSLLTSQNLNTVVAATDYNDISTTTCLHSVVRYHSVNHIS